MGNAGDLKYHKVRDAIVGIMNNWARVLEPTPMDIGQVGGPVRERVTTGMEETNSPLSMWLQLGRACQAFVFVAGDLAISPESAQHQRAKARGRERRVVKAAWISGSREKVSLSREDGVGMVSLGLPITDLGSATRGKVVVRDIRGSVGCVVKLVTRRQSAAERGVEAVALRLLRRRRWWRMLVGSGRLPRSKKGGQRRKGGVDAALRRRSTEVVFVHKNKFGVLEVDCGDLAVYAVEASAQVRELDVARSTRRQESRFARKSGPSHLGSKLWTGLLKLVNASGGRIEHFGKRALSFNPETCDGRTMEAKFEVTNVRKPLVAVARVFDAGKSGAVWSKARR